ncbi:MAG: SRPBCC domain-containing protein [Casimicrobiaceae bacterium]
MNMTSVLAVAVVAIAGSVLPASAQSLAPDIVVVKVVDAPVADVWKAWTTAEGIESFFAPKAVRVEPWPGGAFELWFGLDSPEGSRGSEGCRVHSITPMEQFVFEWNAPPTLPEIRSLRTLVYLDFKALDGKRTEVTLRNFGYGQGEAWAKSRAYFTSAWNAVMTGLEKRFAKSS